MAFKDIYYYIDKAVQMTAIFPAVVFLEHFVFLYGTLNLTNIVHYHWPRMGK